MKQTIGFGLHLPIIRFKGEADHSREQILSFAKKAEHLDYDYLGVNDHIVFRTTSWLDALITISAVAVITTKIKVGTSIGHNNLFVYFDTFFLSESLSLSK